MEKENLFITDEEQRVRLAIERMGLNSCAVFKPEERIIDYVAKDKSLIFEKKFNEKYGIKLRDKALKSPLFDTDKFVKDFENLIYEIY